jgi:hydroxymethylglutaryl-CoA lyase
MSRYSLKNRFINIRELGPREGFQISKFFVDTEKKIELINSLSRTGLKFIEFSSFVNPKLVPNLSDCKEVFKRIDKVDGVVYAALVLNLRGTQDAIYSGVKSLNTTIFASESLNKKNNNRTIDESFNEALEMLKLCNDNGVKLEGGVSAAFGCPIEKKVDFKNVLKIVDFWYSNGVKSIMLADTTGEALPDQVHCYVSTLKDKYPDAKFIAHFHDTRGVGMANLLVALEDGIDDVDCSIGGMGGCPFAPTAAGNVPTEDVVYLIHSLGGETGIDLDKLTLCAILAEDIVGFKLPGKFKDYYKSKIKSG